jgi:membrane-bound lytic murein transglycosylase B
MRGRIPSYSPWSGLFQIDLKQPLKYFLFAAALALPLASVTAGPSGYPHRKEVKQFIAEMVEKHRFTRSELNRVFGQAQFQPTIIKAMEQPAETALASWQAYRALFINPQRVEAGVQFWNRHADPLKRAAAEFGVPEGIIVGIIGVETTYGRNIGTYRVIDALSTLAFDYPKRADFFRAELENYLVFTREMRIDALRVKGSYAGAIGIPQFMPGSYRRFAVDYDGDGQIKLATSAADAIGSIGNFLRSHGWVRGEPVAFGAEVKGEDWRKLADAGVAPAHRPADLSGFGVKPAAALPPDALCALIELETPGQPSDFRVTLQNFFVLTRYNRSSLYAAAVVDLAAELARARTGPPVPPAPEIKKENS